MSKRRRLNEKNDLYKTLYSSVAAVMFLSCHGFIVRRIVSDVATCVYIIVFYFMSIT